MIVLRISLFVTTFLIANCLSDKQLFRRNRQLPSFGRLMRQEFLLDSQLVSLNHGAFGSHPRAVQTSMLEYHGRVEANPDLWIINDSRTEVTKVRELLAKLVQASADDIVMILNTTSGVNAILRSMFFGFGERILQFSTTYNGMQSVIKYICDSSNGAVSTLTFNITYPISQDQIVNEFEAFLDRNRDPANPIRIAVIDHIISLPAVILPIERIIPLLKARNITVVVDAAHAMGQIPINITALQPDYYIATCYKWLYGAKSCAMMYVDKKHQSTIHPAQISFAYTEPTSYQDEFSTTGTMDYIPYLSVIAALKFREDVGGEEAIMSYNHKLAVDGGTYLANVFGTEYIQELDQIGSMVDVRLPINNVDDPRITANFWSEALKKQYPLVNVRTHKHGDGWYIRLSAQIYTDLNDFEVVGNVFYKICNELNGNNSTGMSYTGSTATALAAYSAYSIISDGIF